MKFSEKWLREWVNPNVDTATLAEGFTMAGLEVDSLEAAAPPFNNVVIGEVLTVEKHPEADKLNLTTVNVGSETLKIVCGASNVAPGIRVPTAMAGATLPNGMTIKKAKLRGAESHGMLCSEAEIGLSESAEGLMILPGDAPVGMSIREYLDLDDTIIEVDFTPNRGDCLSVAGMAREAGVLNNTVVNVPLVNKVAATIDETREVVVHATTDCPRYLGRVIRDIDASANTPLWMEERLRRAGLRSISPTVDVTNYVLLELGQPMHAFDLDKLSGKIIVRRAEKKEKLKLLDDSEVELDEQVLVIADEKQAHAFAGVMGGLESSVTESTQHIFLECALFSPDAIRGKGRRFGLQTDSSYRFERGVDFELQARAMERATALIIEIAGGNAGPIVEAVSQADMPRRDAIALRTSRVERVLGITIDNKQIENILQGLGMTVSSTADGWQVTPPSYRYDISIEADLVEEVGRVYGYNNIPTHMPLGELKLTDESEAELGMPRLKEILIDSGYNEVITYSFVDADIQSLLDPETETVAISNPISAEMSVMRTTLWSSLLKTLVHNQTRQQNRVRIFETGMQFSQKSGVVAQDLMVAGLAYGDALPINWSEKPRKVDFYDVKADLERLFCATGGLNGVVFESAQHPALHPGQSARVYKNGIEIGWLGCLHPVVQKKLDLPTPAYVFELSYAALKTGSVPGFQAISKFPSIRRDLALVVDEQVTARKIVEEVEKTSPQLLKDIDIFDIYRGKGVPEGSKSLAIAITLQDDTQTLTDDRVEAVVRTILNSLKDSTGATLRE
ncbi:MAG: phenylalanine--tRNA ligase subunit beta [Gammaproteobacteria bacterium]|nr:phenylalanine--tRNA ligase subunit beta [Gammaproteobacteria bacterium]